jgi:hypothetical protein
MSTTVLTREDAQVYAAALAQRYLPRRLELTEIQRVIRDENGQPRRCQCCATRLATTHLTVLVICDGCNEARELRIAELERIG